MSATAPYIYHYTDKNGLTGIIGSQQLWATRFDGLNDKSEVEHFHQLLVSAVLKKAIPAALKVLPASFSARRRFERNGGFRQVLSRDITNLLTSSHEAAFAGNEFDQAVFPPFITSFCTHDRSQPYEQKNGLLSQWRGYGKNGRYALVLDTNALEKNLELEKSSFEYSFMQLDRVVYNNSALDFEGRFNDVITHFVQTFVQFAASGDLASVDNIAEDDNLIRYISGATLLKHQGFREEQEIRVVAFPMQAAHEEKARQISMEDGTALKPVKPQFARVSGERPVEYIKLFGDACGQLPIRRIIVGPSSDQEANFQYAKKLVGPRVPVVKSETPFID
ncbi:MAG: DUF2971 domain-containing protein [Parvibaculum sp.]